MITSVVLMEMYRVYFFESCKITSTTHFPFHILILLYKCAIILYIFFCEVKIHSVLSLTYQTSKQIDQFTSQLSTTQREFSFTGLVLGL